MNAARPNSAPRRHAGEGRHPRLSLIKTSVNPQITQINAERTRPEICVNLRNLRMESSFRDLNSMALTSKGKKFFFKKKNQKTFAPLRAALKMPGSKMNKVFLLLFVHKKKCFLALEAKSWMPAFAGMTLCGLGYHG
jgi:hypothetical protein